MDLIELARQSLAEDAYENDVTVALLPSALRQQERGFALVAKEAGIFSGRAWVLAICEAAGLRSRGIFDEGQSFQKGDAIVLGMGPAGQVLSSERTLLNTLQQLCGVATRTQAYVARVQTIWRQAGHQGAAPAVYHTRKTLPLLRELQLQAVLAGGGKRHRTKLSDRVLVKENHKYLAAQGGVAFAQLVGEALRMDSQALIEVENLEEFRIARQAGARHLLCDNFRPEQLREISSLKDADLEIEISGGLRLDTIADYVQPGVTRLSVGALTHSVPAIDISLDWVEL